jgi:Ser/Thr protein kinase RdoA (MazF antagonist)
VHPDTPDSEPPPARGLAAHLGNRYGIDIARITELDSAVFRIDRRDGPSWVARVFDGRPAADVAGEAALLQMLADGGFPAERCADDEPLSQLDGRPVLVTRWVDGQRSDGRGRSFGVLGALLGALHARDGGSLRSGGAWHHLSSHGGPREEIDAAIALLEDAERLVPPEQHASYDRVRDALEDLDDCRDLPHAVVHPDFVPANAITTPDDERVIVDWAGAGRGPRLWSLAFLLWAGGARDLRLADAAASRYARRIRLHDDELARLPGVLAARPLTLDVWSFCHRRRELRDVEAALRRNREAARTVGAAVASTLSG